MIKNLGRLFIFAVLFIAMPLWAKPLHQRSDIQKFITHMVSAYGFNHGQLNNLFKHVHINKTLLSKMDKPYEAKPWYQYQPLFVTEVRAQEGAVFWKQHAKKLQQAEKQYGVPASIIVAILGVETNYGRSKGTYRVIDTLTTLAFHYPKRSRFFRKELQEFLLLTREQRLNPLNIRGSYAGAMGYPQFMPSSYRHYAVDYTHSGQVDLINNPTDAIGSIANYMKQHGWQAHAPLVAPVKVSGHAYKKLMINSKKPNYLGEQLEHYGVWVPRKVDHVKMGLIQLKQTPFSYHYWLGFNNFYVITRYNTSKLYAMAVVELAHEIQSIHQHA